MALSFIVTGGYLDGSGEAVAWHVDLERERAEPWLRWSPPEHLRVPGKGFAAGCRTAEGRHLYVAAHCALVRIDVARAEVSGVLFQPGFNDLHHVALSEGRLYVVNTGLGTLDIHEQQGRFVGSHSLLPTWVNHQRMAGLDPHDWDEALSPGWDGAPPAPWPQPPREDSYLDVGAQRGAAPFARLKVADYLHPNHVCVTPSQTLVTCLYDGSVRDARTFETVLSMPGSHPHDGLIAADAFWTTSIDGVVRAAPVRQGRVVGPAEPRLSVFDTGHAGWCRGLWTDGRRMAVGLTEVRRGYLPRHRWADREPEGTETSVLLLDVADGRLLARCELTDSARHSKLYSLLPTEPLP